MTWAVPQCQPSGSPPSPRAPVADRFAGIGDRFSEISTQPCVRPGHSHTQSLPTVAAGPAPANEDTMKRSRHRPRSTRHMNSWIHPWAPNKRFFSGLRTQDQAQAQAQFCRSLPLAYPPQVRVCVPWRPLAGAYPQLDLQRSIRGLTKQKTPMRGFLHRGDKFQPISVDDERLNQPQLDGLWQKCPNCGETLCSREVEHNLNVCPNATTTSASAPANGSSCCWTKEASRSGTRTSSPPIRSASSIPPVPMKPRWKSARDKTGETESLITGRRTSRGGRSPWPWPISASWAPAWVRSSAKS